MKHLIIQKHLLAQEQECGTLHKVTVSQLRQRGNVKQVSRETGMPYVWLRCFAASEVAFPDVNKVEKLFTFLTGEEL